MNKLKNKDIIQKLCKGNPKWMTLFLLWNEKDDNFDINSLKKTFKLFLKHKNLLKSHINIDEARDILLIQGDNRSSIEIFSDQIHEKISMLKKLSFIKSIKSHKYKKLFTKDVEMEIGLILDNKISESFLKDNFFIKIGAYKTSDDLLLGLRIFKSKNIKWSKKWYLDKIKDLSLNVTILESQNNYMIIEVEDYNACKELGTNAWCIVREENMFNTYMDKLRRQIIALNFSLPIESNNSMIGFTICPLGNIYDSYLRNDKKTFESLRNSFVFTQKSNKSIDNYIENLNVIDAFYFICESGLVEYLNYFIMKVKIDPSINNNRGLMLAAENGHSSVIECLIDDKRVNPADNDNEAIISASTLGDTRALEVLLLDNRVDPSVSRSHPVFIASLIGNINALELLLSDCRVDPSDANNRSIVWAVKNKRNNIIDRLLKESSVCVNLGVDWINKHLTIEQQKIYNNTISIKNR